MEPLKTRIDQVDSVLPADGGGLYAGTRIALRVGRVKRAVGCFESPVKGVCRKNQALVLCVTSVSLW